MLSVAACRSCVTESCGETAPQSTDLGTPLRIARQFCRCYIQQLVWDRVLPVFACSIATKRRSNYWRARVAPKTHPSHISPIDLYSSIDLDRKTWSIVKTRWTSKGFWWFLSFSSDLRGRLWIRQITNQTSNDLTKRDRRLEKIGDPGMYSDMLRKSVKHKISCFHHTYHHTYPLVMTNIAI